ncbi:MAG: putative NEK protein kinase [Streblomastix strix]|uniref:non-specific serine/threonine protein kinase n=1 Tax=Streblomastix strix TaxID=222440 RepID=A0A5J4V5P7_9EUKA|nr:MAG: putative NEK protein kinase [Streblomastix strix]
MRYETQRQRDQVDIEILTHKESYELFYQSAHSQSVPIVEPLGFFLNEDNTKAYFVMEYCENGDLWGYIKNMKKSGEILSEDDAWEIISQICSVAHQLHMHRIIHGDLKPQNFLLTKDNQIKLCDFGFAQKMIEGKDSIDSQGFTMLYVAPETLYNIFPEVSSLQNQKLKLTTAADIWTIGVVCYELLAQRHPFMNENDQQSPQIKIVRHVADNEPAALPYHYSEKIRNLILRMLVKDPQCRIKASDIIQLPEIQAKLEKK